MGGTFLRRAVLAACVLFLAPVAARGAAAPLPSVLNLIPSSASFVIAFRHVGPLDRKIHRFAVRLGHRLPPDEDPLAEIQQQLHIQLDPNGTAVGMYVGKFNAAGAAGANLAAFILPVLHPNKVLRAQGGGQGPFHIFTMQLGFMPAWAAFRGHYMVLALQANVVAALMKQRHPIAAVMSAETKASWARNDAVLMMSVAGLRKPALQHLAAWSKSPTALSARFCQEMGVPADPRLRAALVQKMCAAATAVLDHTQNLMIGAQVSSQGLGFDFTWSLDPTSRGFFGRLKPLHAPYLQGLLYGRYMIAGALQWNGPTLAAQVDKWQNELLAGLPTGPADKPFEQNLRRQFTSVATQLRLLNATRFASYAPRHPGKATRTWMHSTLITSSPHPHALMKSALHSISRQSLFALQDMFHGLNHGSADAFRAIFPLDMQGDRGPGGTPQRRIPPISVHIAPGAVTTGGLRYTRLSIQRVKHGAAVSRGQYGRKDAPVQVYLAVTPKTVVTVEPGHRNTLAAQAAAVKNNRDMFRRQSEIHAVQRFILPRPLALLYLPMDRWAALALPKPRQAKQGTQHVSAVALGGPPSPAVLSIAASPAGFEWSLHLPMAALSSMASRYAGANRMQP